MFVEAVTEQLEELGLAVSVLERPRRGAEPGLHPAELEADDRDAGEQAIAPGYRRR